MWLAVVEWTSFVVGVANVPHSVASSTSSWCNYATQDIVNLLEGLATGAFAVWFNCFSEDVHLAVSTFFTGRLVHCHRVGAHAFISV